MVTPEGLKVLAGSRASTAPPLLFKNCSGRAEFCGANKSPQAVGYRLKNQTSEASESECQIGGNTDRQTLCS